jgi:hypothetical protein
MARSADLPANDNDPDPYLRGIEDFARGVPRHENPFDGADYGTTLWESWFDGWDDASDEFHGAGVNN